MSEQSPVALVLSGGGARGAYEVGVVAGIVEVLDKTRGARGAFDIFTGTSVGAINATYLAAHADAHDLGIDGLIRHWESLELNTHLRLDPIGLVGRPGFWPFSREKTTVDPTRHAEHYGRAVLDPRAIEALVESGVDWSRLRRNIQTSVVHALVVSALDITGGRTTVFADHAPGVALHPSRDPRRETRDEAITAEHVLASAAIPFLFPARLIGKTYYCDGGLRFNTPISPALRAGAERLVVISLRHGQPPTRATNDATAVYPNLLFLMGKVLNALLLDPIDYDLQVLHRLNKIMEVLERTLDEQEHAEFLSVLERERGTSYRKVQTLVFRPSEDIGVLAGKFLREEHLEWKGVTKMISFVLRRAAALGASAETDLASFLLFDREFAKALIELGRRDALRRAPEIREFFGSSRRSVPPSIR